MDMDTNTNSGIKRPAGELIYEPSTSKKVQIIDSAIGIVVSARDNARVSIENVTVYQREHKQQFTQPEPARGIKLQVTDPIASFRGRDKQLRAVKHAFNKPKAKELYNLVVVCGYGGIGKTEFARMYIHQNRTDFENIIWIYAEFEDSIKNSFVKLQKELDRRGHTCFDHQDVYKYLNNFNCFFVFDNVENMRGICKFLPKESNKSQFLITSQFQTWSPYESFELNTLDLDSARNIMKAVLTSHMIEFSESQIETLVNKFEPIPLVLQIGAGFVCQEALELKCIGKTYNIDDIMQTLSSGFELVTQDFPPFSQDSYTKSVFEALFRTLEKIWTKKDKVSKLAANILGLSAYLSSDNIVKEMLMNLLKIEDEHLFNKPLATLAQFSIIRVYSFIDIHRTVQECVQYYCSETFNSNEYYMKTLYVLLNKDDDYRLHHKILIQHGENNFQTFCTFYNENKCTTLHEVLIESASCKVLELLLKKCDISRNPEFLCEAAASERADIIQLLLHQGIDFNVVDDKGYSALYYAHLLRDDYCHYVDALPSIWTKIEALIKVGADANSRNIDGNTIIHSLCNLMPIYRERDEYIFALCALMIKVGGDPNLKNNSGKTPADLALEHGLTLTHQLLNAALSGNRYILHVAAECVQLDFFRFLTINEVCDINKQDDSGQTVFHVLASLTNQDAVNELFEKNLLHRRNGVQSSTADLNIVNYAGETAMDVARRCGREKLLDLFNAWTQPGCIVYQIDAHHRKIAHFPFVSSGDQKDVNFQDETGCTLLHVLCDLDIQSYNEKFDVMKLVAHLVIQHYADVLITNNAGDTAADVARRLDHHLLADFLDTQGHEFELLHAAIQYKHYDLIRYVWWRYFYRRKSYTARQYHVLRMLCDYKNTTVTDTELITIINNLNLLQAAKVSPDIYNKVLKLATKRGREILVAWLQAQARDWTTTSSPKGQPTILL